MSTDKKNPKWKLVAHDKAFHDRQWSVEILVGDYKGVVYQYDSVRFVGDDDDWKLHYNTINCANPNQKDLDSKEFVAVMDEILLELLSENFNESGNTDTKQSAEN